MSGLDAIAIVVFAWIFLTGLIAIEAKERFTSVLMLSAMGLGAAFLFAWMRAPDVAMTEAVIGAGLTSAIFLLVLLRMKRGGEDAHE
ncbi:MAG TPA: DUF4040 domain-containing protein [Thermotogota bacterium]|mgnify:CR=1 FL=1|nr:DUF4040 domain-containing protein [Thermotogota bacterium]HRW93435.1 DUF4040 domain-containing protein [Thermotogota bacterium]